MSWAGARGWAVCVLGFWGLGCGETQEREAARPVDSTAPRAPSASAVGSAAELEPATEGGPRVEAPGVSLLLVQASGQPAAGVTVDLVYGPGAEPKAEVLDLGPTDGVGRLRLPSFSDRELSASLVPRILTAADPRINLDSPLFEAAWAGTPNEPVRFFVEDLGSLELRLLDSAGRPLGAALELAVAPLGQPGRALGALPWERGLRLPHVAVGQRFELLAPPGWQLTPTRVDGPLEPGEVARWELWCTQSSLWRLRAVASNGRPLAREPLLVTLFSGGVQRGPRYELLSDGDGAVAFPPELESGADGPWELHVARASGAIELREQGRFRVIPGTGPVQDLGVLVLSAAPILAAGRVVGADRQPVPGAIVRLTAVGSDPRWAELARVGTDEGGGFLLRGEFPDHPVELVAEAPGHRMGQPVSIDRAQDDLLLELAQAASVVGRFEGAPKGSLLYLGVQDGAGGTLATTLVQGVEGGAPFVLHGLPAGPAMLFAEDLAALGRVELGSLEIPPGGVLDVGAVVFPGGPVPVAVEVLDENGRAIDGALLSAPDSARGHHVRSLLLPPEGLPLLVRAPHHRQLELWAAPPGPVTAVLKAAPQLLLRPGAPFAPEPGWDLGVRLWPAQWASAPAEGPRWFGGRPELELSALFTGAARLELWLARHGSGERVVVLFHEAAIEIPEGGGELVLPIPKALWESHRELLQRGR